MKRFSVMSEIQNFENNFFFIEKIPLNAHHKHDRYHHDEKVSLKSSNSNSTELLKICTRSRGRVRKLSSQCTDDGHRWTATVRTHLKVPLNRACFTLQTIFGIYHIGNKTYTFSRHVGYSEKWKRVLTNLRLFWELSISFSFFTLLF